MSQVNHERLADWVVEGWVLYSLSEEQREMVAEGKTVPRTGKSKTSLTVAARSPQEAIDGFVREYTGDVKVTLVRVA